MNRLKEIRQEKKLSQKELADYLGINEKTISRWENGESTIKSDKAQALAEHFGVSVGYLLGLDNDKNIIQEILELKQYRHLLIGGEVYIAEADVLSLFTR